MPVAPAPNNHAHGAEPPHKRTVFFAFFLIVAIMTAVIAGLLAAMLHSTGMDIAKTVAITFATTLGLAMTAYHFLDRRE
jgi:FtsH-binding integral membrane protein